MSLIEWQESFNLGIESVDRDHRELIGLINRLYASIQEKASTDEVLAALSEIFARLAEHFDEEESVMRAARYPAYREHKEDHETLLDELDELMDEIQFDKVYDENRLTKDLLRFFGEHFRVHDARLHAASKDA